MQYIWEIKVEIYLQKKIKFFIAPQKKIDEREKKYSTPEECSKCSILGDQEHPHQSKKSKVKHPKRPRAHPLEECSKTLVWPQYHTIRYIKGPLYKGSVG